MAGRFPWRWSSRSRNAPGRSQRREGGHDFDYDIIGLGVEAGGVGESRNLEGVGGVRKDVHVVGVIEVEACAERGYVGYGEDGAEWGGGLEAWSLCRDTCEIFNNVS